MGEKGNSRSGYVAWKTEANISSSARGAHATSSGHAIEGGRVGEKKTVRHATAVCLVMR